MSFFTFSLSLGNEEGGHVPPAVDLRLRTVVLLSTNDIMNCEKCVNNKIIIIYDCTILIKNGGQEKSQHKIQDYFCLNTCFYMTYNISLAESIN